MLQGAILCRSYRAWVGGGVVRSQGQAPTVFYVALTELGVGVVRPQGQAPPLFYVALLGLNKLEFNPVGVEFQFIKP